MLLGQLEHKMHTNSVYVLYLILLEIKTKKEAEYNLKSWTPDNSFIIQ